MINKLFELLKNYENFEIIEIYENSICCKNSEKINDVEYFEYNLANEIENILKISIIINVYDSDKFEIIV